VGVWNFASHIKGRKLIVSEMMVPRLIFVHQIEEMIAPGENCIMRHLANSNAHQILHIKGKDIPVTGRGGP
jgi:hypothetical protein